MAESISNSIPDAEITWLTDSAMAPLVAAHPDIDQVIPFSMPTNSLRRIPSVKTYVRVLALKRLVQSLDIAQQYDIAIVPRGGVDPTFSAHAAWMMNVPRSIGYSHLIEPECDDHNFSDSLFTQLITEPPAYHEAARAIALLEFSGIAKDALQLWNQSQPVSGLHAIAESVDERKLFGRLGLASDKPFVVLAPGAGAPNKQWPAENFRRLCQRITSGHPDYDIVTIGSAADRPLTQSIVQVSEYRVIDCAGKLSLLELVALIGHSSVFIGNDSGPGHIAGAQSIPTISLHSQAKGYDPFHRMAPEHSRPLGPHVTVLQPNSFLRPCRYQCEASAPHCITQIQVSEVWDAFQSAIKISRETLPTT